jgi:CRP-like cAMP-binding protein
MIASAALRTFASGQYLWRQGEQADALCLVLSGDLSLEIAIPGQGSLRVEVIRAGGTFGWSWLVHPHRWRFDVRAMTEVSIAAFDGHFLRNQCERDAVFGYTLLKSLTPVLGHRLQATSAKLIELYGVRGRV